MGENRDGTADQEHSSDTTRPMAPPRADALAFSRATSSPRAEKARLAHDLYLIFCDRLHVPADASGSCVLYLTWLWDSEHLSGAQLDRRLSLIDHVQALEDRVTFRERPEIRTYLRGLLRTANLECVTEQATPVYREILAALVDATVSPTPIQMRARAAVLLLHHTRWPAVAVARLRWCDIDLRRPDTVTVHFPLGQPVAAPVRGAGPTSPVAPDRLQISLPGGDSTTRPPVVIGRTHNDACLGRTLSAVRAIPSTEPFVTWGPIAYAPRAAPYRIQKAQTALRDAGDDVHKALASVSTSPEQVRNRALLLLGYGAALTATETRNLLQSSISPSDLGLMLDVPGRRDPTGVLADPGTPYDPVSAWESWLDVVAIWGLEDATSPAFLDTHKLGVYPSPVAADGLGHVVADPARRLGLTGQYSWHSLRWGLIRTAIRSGEQASAIASFTNLRINALALHEKRENVLRRSVAGQLGL